MFQDNTEIAIFIAVVGGFFAAIGVLLTKLAEFLAAHLRWS